jgi:predicted transcriptional regulator
MPILKPFERRAGRKFPVEQMIIPESEVARACFGVKRALVSSIFLDRSGKMPL